MGLVYEQELGSELVPMTGTAMTHYRVWVGMVCWDPGATSELIATVLMQDGDIEDWGLAKSRNEIRWRVPPHIKDADVARVLDAMRRVSGVNEREAA
ncbi:MAG: hypothetical protein AAGA81_03880 [Acidobacteriota bacterium]